MEKSGRTFIVAEIGQAHDGSLGILHSFIDACANAGVDAVKFQMHFADAESSPEEPFRKAFSYVDATRYDYWKRMSFTEDQWVGICEHCAESGVEFLATPFSNFAIDMLQRLNVRRYKVGSGDITNGLLLEKLKQTGKEVILSTGLGTVDEIGKAVDLLRNQGVAVMQCTTMYPTPPDKIGLGAIVEFKARYNCPVGLSDHSGTVYPSLAAVALGASLIECHVTYDRKMFGPDAIASLTIDELTELVKGIRFLEKARGGSAGQTLTPQLQELRTMFGRTIAVSRDLPQGHVLCFDDLEGRKPAGQGIGSDDFGSVVGRPLKVAKRQYEFLKKDDLA